MGAAGSAQPLEVESSLGRVTGYDSGDGFQSFRGMPYARVPGRWQPAAPIERWQDVIDGSGQPPCSPRVDVGMPGLGTGEQRKDGETLHVSVHRPSAAGAPRPVMVWIHGGGFIMGSPDGPLYNPQQLVATGDLILVTLNYRLGVLGSLDTRSLGLDMDGLNQHLRDQLLALRWVRDHIADFGGDPQRVTVFGESAGATSVACHMGCPQAQGLFQRAILQSCAAGQLMTAEQGALVASRVLEAATEAGGDPARLAALSDEQLFAAGMRASAGLLSSGVRLAFVPTASGGLFPAHPLHAIAGGLSRGVATLVGNNLDEWRFFGAGDKRLDAMDRETTRTLVQKRLAAGGEPPDGQAEQLLSVYGWPEGAEASSFNVFCGIEGDRIYRNSGLAVAEAMLRHTPDVYAYLLTWASRSARLGSCHTVDLPFVFGSLDAPGMAGFVGDGPEARTLSAAMVEAWTRFANAQPPGAPSLPTWPHYDLERRSTMVLGRERELVDDPHAERRRAWGALLPDAD